MTEASLLTQDEAKWLYHQIKDLKPLKYQPGHHVRLVLSGSAAAPVDRMVSAFFARLQYEKGFPPEENLAHVTGVLCRRFATIRDNGSGEILLTIDLDRVQVAAGLKGKKIPSQKSNQIKSDDSSLPEHIRKFRLRQNQNSSEKGGGGQNL